MTLRVYRAVREAETPPLRSRSALRVRRAGAPPAKMPGGGRVQRSCRHPAAEREAAARPLAVRDA